MQRDGVTKQRVTVVCGLFLVGPILVSVACTHKIAVEAPKDPIVINMNVKIEHEVRVRVDDELEEVFEENDEIY